MIQKFLTFLIDKYMYNHIGKLFAVTNEIFLTIAMKAKFDFFRAIVSRYTRACKAVFQRENRSARKSLTKRLNFNRNNGLILMEQTCLTKYSFFHRFESIIPSLKHLF